MALPTDCEQEISGGYDVVARLEPLERDALVRGIGSGDVSVVDVRWFGENTIEVTYKDAAGHLDSQLLYREDEPRLEIVEQGRPWSFDGDGALFRLVSEAQRIRLAHLFDKVLAVHTSLVDPLPHQIMAVYEEMLPLQPLRPCRRPDHGPEVVAGEDRVGRHGEVGEDPRHLLQVGHVRSNADRVVAERPVMDVGGGQERGSGRVISAVGGLQKGGQDT